MNIFAQTISRTIESIPTPYEGLVLVEAVEDGKVELSFFSREEDLVKISEYPTLFFDRPFKHPDPIPQEVRDLFRSCRIYSWPEEILASYREQRFDYPEVGPEDPRETLARMVDKSFTVDETFGTFDFSSNLYYAYEDSEFPVSPAYRIEYWGSYYDLEALGSVLDSHPFVLSHSREDVPYYNVDISGTQKIIASVLLPQDVHDDLVRLYRDERGETYWSVRVKDHLTWGSTPDTLGIQHTKTPEGPPDEFY